MVCFLGICVPRSENRDIFNPLHKLLLVLLFYFNDHQNHLTRTYGSAYFVSLGVKQAASIY